MINPQPKQKTIIDRNYLSWIRKQPCYDCIGGFGDITYSHQTIKIPGRGKGMSLKDHDILALPKHTSEHQLEHQAIYKIKNKERGIYTRIMQYKTELNDEEFIYFVNKFTKRLYGKYLYHNAIGYIISIWEDYK
ncbi:DUF968 domain-containing protein [Candidatus Pacearchaeota archaeon]|nr:DUF968 domain-containing protein [Candidatus Pacearchaeota archaeon]